MVQIRQFFEDGSGRLSMGRLMPHMAYYPASFVVFAATVCKEWATAAGMAGAILTAYVYQYRESKRLDIEQTKADNNAPTS